MPGELDQRFDPHALVADTLRAAEFGQINHEARAGNNAAETADERDAGLGRAAGRNQIVDQQHFLMATNSTTYGPILHHYYAGAKLIRLW